MSDKSSEEDELRAIERLDAGEAAQSEEELRLRAPYEALVARVRETEEAVEPPPGWQDRALARWSASRRRRWIRAAAASASALAAAAAALIMRCSAMGGPALAYDLVHASASLRGGEAVVGDRIELESQRGSLLLYLEGRKLAQCPGDSACRASGDAFSLAWPFTAPGTYDMVSFQLDGEPWLPLDGALDLDLVKARELKVQWERKSLRVSR